MEFNVVTPNEFNIGDILSEYSVFSGEPTMAGFIPYITSKYVSPDYKVAISANGADEIFFGYTRIPTPDIHPSFFEKRLSRNRINVNGKSFSPEDQILNIFRHPENFTIPLLGETKTLADLYQLLE